jgi:hypothetical protein
LYSRPASVWESTIKKLESAEQQRFKAYRPLTYAILHELKKPGSGLHYLETSLVTYKAAPKTTNKMKANMREFFSTFQSEMKPEISGTREILYFSSRRIPFLVGDYAVYGGIHALVVTKNHRFKYIHFHTSDWTKEKVEAYQELLIIMCQQLYDVKESDIWWMDLRSGEITPLRSRKRVRNEVVETVRHLYRLFERAA